VKRSWISTQDGMNLFYRDWGSGLPVVFLAGWALPSDMWNYQIALLPEPGFRCIAYDRRGHGRSDDSGDGFDYDTLANDLAGVLETLDLREATLVSHSMGTGEVVRYLSRRGAPRVSRIALSRRQAHCIH
jgi:non-heme chloroperoxidase